MTNYARSPMTHYAADRHSAFFRRNLQAIGTRTEGGLSSLDALIGIPLTPLARLIPDQHPPR